MYMAGGGTLPTSSSLAPFMAPVLPWLWMSWAAPACPLVAPPLLSPFACSWSLELAGSGMSGTSTTWPGQGPQSSVAVSSSAASMLGCHHSGKALVAFSDRREGGIQGLVSATLLTMPSTLAASTAAASSVGATFLASVSALWAA